MANSAWLDGALQKAAQSDAFNFRRRTRRSATLELLQSKGAANILRNSPEAIDPDTWGLVLVSKTNEF